MKYFRLLSRLWFSFIFNLFIFVFFVFTSKDFCNWGHCDQVVLWRIFRHSRPFTTEAPRANGKSYEAGYEGSLFSLLQTFTSMWSFYGCRFLEWDTSSLWHEFGARDVDIKVFSLSRSCLGSRCGMNLLS